jgi:hypothetical protein
MNQPIRSLAAVLAISLSATLLLTAQNKSAVLTAAELKQSVPAAFFFRGQSATVQVRNSGGLRVGKDSLVLAALVDTAGYSTEVKQKYQGMLITEVKLNIGGSELAPGQYGFGFNADNKFYVMDVAANDLLKVDIKTDQDLKRPVPLKLMEEGGAFRLYAGRQYVELSVQ